MFAYTNTNTCASERPTHRAKALLLQPCDCRLVMSFYVYVYVSMIFRPSTRCCLCIYFTHLYRKESATQQPLYVLLPHSSSFFMLFLILLLLLFIEFILNKKKFILFTFLCCYFAVGWLLFVVFSSSFFYYTTTKKAHGLSKRKKK